MVDLVKMKAIIWDPETQGMRFEYREIPSEMLEACRAARAHLVESAAESSEELMNKYLEEGELAEEEIVRGIRQATIANSIIPVFCGSAFKNKGVQALLDGVIQYLPSPWTSRRWPAWTIRRGRSRGWRATTRPSPVSPSRS